MPRDMGEFDLARLRRLVDARPNLLFPLLTSKPFDRVEWAKDGVACIAFTSVWSLGRTGSETDPTPRVHRDWYLARGTDMANAWYRSVHSDEASTDIADCEEMVRSIRLECGGGDVSLLPRIDAMLAFAERR